MSFMVGPAAPFLIQDRVSTPEGRLPLAGMIQDGFGITPRYPLRRYPCYAIVLITKGKGVYEHASGQTEPVSAGEAILVFPGVPHTYGPTGGKTWDELFVVVEGPGIERWHASGLISPERPIVRLGRVEPWRTSLLQILKSPPPQNVWQALEELHRVMAFASSMLEARQEEACPGSAWLARAKSLIERTLAEDVPMEEIAARMREPYETFRKRFQREAGASPGRYREQRRIARATELLRYTQLSHAEIAQVLGYGDALYFSKRFRHALGLSPRTYRQLERAPSSSRVDEEGKRGKG